MSYRKKHNAPKAQRLEQQSLFNKGYKNPGVLRDISTSLLITGQRYQRPVQEPDVDKLIRKWNPRKLRPLVVSFRDGRYYVIDGQHRLAALRKMNDGRDVFVECLVYDDLTYEQEADLYYELSKADRPLSSAEATKALIESQSDPEVTEINRMIESAGFRWLMENQRAGEHEIGATRTVISVYRLLGREAFARMLSLLELTWHGAPQSLTAMMLSGMALFLKTYEMELDDKAFAQHMEMVEPSAILRRASTDFSTNKNALRCAKVIWDKYNSGRHGKKKLPYRFNG